MSNDQRNYWMSKKLLVNLFIKMNMHLFGAYILGIDTEPIVPNYAHIHIIVGLEKFSLLSFLTLIGWYSEVHTQRFKCEFRFDPRKSTVI